MLKCYIWTLFRKKTDTPVLAYLVIQALSTLVKLVAVIILVAGGAALLSVSEEAQLSGNMNLVSMNFDYTI